MPAGCDCTCLNQQLCISSSSLSLSRAALPYCSVSFIFPTSLLSLPPFFFSLFPFSLPPLHYITLALTHYQCHMALLSFVPHWPSDNMQTLSDSLLMELLRWMCLQKSSNIYSAVNQGIVQEGILVYWEGGGVTDVWASYEKMQKLLCCVCCSFPEWVWAISDLLISESNVVFESQTQL